MKPYMMPKLQQEMAAYLYNGKPVSSRSKRIASEVMNMISEGFDETAIGKAIDYLIENDVTVQGSIRANRGAMQLADVLDLIKAKRVAKDVSEGPVAQNFEPVSSYMMSLEDCLAEAKDAWHSKEANLPAVLKIACVAVECIEKHGAHGFAK